MFKHQNILTKPCKLDSGNNICLFKVCKIDFVLLQTIAAVEIW